MKRVLALLVCCALAVSVFSVGVYADVCAHVRTCTQTENEIAVTCTQDGGYDEVTYCEDCGAELSRRFVSTQTAPGHDIKQTIAQMPKCTEAGVMLNSCKNCTYSFETPIEPMGHNWGKWQVVSEATCTEAGLKRRVCRTNAAHVEEKEIPAPGHDYTETVVPPESTQLGYTIFGCSRCDFSLIGAYTAPTGKLTLQCAARTANAEKVQWKAVKSATGYQVQISTADCKKWDTYATLDAGTTAYVFKSLAAGNMYKFKVRFFIKAENGKNYYSPWSAALSSPTLPTGTSLTALTGASKSFSAQWKQNKTVTSYRLQYTTDKNFKTGIKTITGKSNKTLKTTVKKLSAKKYYYVRIGTYKTIGGVHYFSAWSKIYKVKTK